ncbi:MAG: efflux transporter outer membrane subunit [Pseudoflavonifractor sp.]|nr:efflux transporter outer membrane subunit [Pseudoflavonifractor sp.]
MHYTRFIQLFIYVVTGVSASMAGNPARYLNDSLPERWTYVENFNPLPPSDDAWWKTFDDPLLDSLVAEGEANNYNLLMAARRIEIARNTLLSTRSEYFPQISLDAGWQKARTSGATTAPVHPATTVDYFSLGLSMSWEIDVFGKITAAAKAKKAQLNATRADRDAAMVSVAANIAKAYIELRMYQSELAVSREHLASQEKVVKITEARHEAGLASMLDVSQARTVYYTTLAAIPSLENSINASMTSLAVLLGVYPEAIIPRLTAYTGIPDYRQIPAVGIPMELLRRRPDIVTAEWQLAEYAAELGVAKKDFLPTLSLNGSIGTSAHRAGDLFTDQSFSYTIAPTLSWTVFSGLSRRYAVASAKEQMLAGIDNYNLTVITAVQEVDNAMSSYRYALRKIDATNMVIEQSKKSLDLSVDLYKQGLTAFSNVVDAQMSLLENALSLTTARAQAAMALVSLYQSLGGGWINNDAIQR